MTDPPRIDYAELAKALKEATPGPYKVSNSHGLCVCAAEGVIADLDSATAEVLNLPDREASANAKLFALSYQLAAELLDRQRWIPVSEKLPDDGQEVLCFVVRRKPMNPRAWIDIISYSAEFGWNDIEDQSGGDPQPTCWTPLPAPPSAPSGEGEK